MVFISILKKLWQKRFTRVAEKLYVLGFTPNKITLIGLILVFVSFYFFMKSEFIIGGIIAIFTYLFDSFDGMVARVMKKETAFGKFFDATCDNAIKYVLWFYAFAFTGVISYELSFFLVMSTLLVMFIMFAEVLKLKTISWLPVNFSHFILIGVFLNLIALFAEIIVWFNITFFLINFFAICYLNWE